jgi:hypothetical protein
LKLRDATICAQVVATKDMVETTKRKVDILENQNVLMIFTALDNRNMREDAIE